MTAVATANPISSPHAHTLAPRIAPTQDKETLNDPSTDTTSARTPHSSASTGEGSEPHSTARTRSSISGGYYEIRGDSVFSNVSAKRERERREVKLEDFELIRVVGKGCAGRVLLVRHSSSNTCHAMKAISKRSVLLTGEFDHTLTELSILKRFAMHEPNNPFVSKLNYAFTDRENFYIVMDFYPGGDLATQMEIHGTLGATRTRFYACDIVQALEDIHRNGIICRDLKPENILLNHKGHAVLADFGLSRQFPYRGESQAIDPVLYPSVEPYPEWAGAGLGSLRRYRGKERVVIDTAYSFVGTAEYLAPEVITGPEYSYAVDYWGLGCIILECLIGQCPFRLEDPGEPLSLYNKIAHDPWTDILRRGRYRRADLREEYGLDEVTKDIIDALLQKDPMRRITEPYIKYHEYFREIDWETVRAGEYVDPYPLEIHPMAEYNTRYFPKLQTNEPANVDMSTHNDEGEDGTQHDRDTLYRLEEKRLQQDIEGFRWSIEEYNDMSEQDEVEEDMDIADGPSVESEEREVSDAEDQITAEQEEEVVLPSEEEIADVDQDVGIEATSPPDTSVAPHTPTEAAPDVIPASRVDKSRSSPSSDQCNASDVASPRTLPSIPHEGGQQSDGLPGAMSRVTSGPSSNPIENRTAPERTVSRDVEQKKLPPLPIMARLQRNAPKAIQLPAHLPSSGLSVSDVVSIPSPGLGSPRLVRRHAPMASIDTIPMNRLSIDLHGTITHLSEDDWEELEGESIPSLPNGAPTASGSRFFNRLRNKPSQIITSGLRRQVKSSDSSRETSPTKAPKSGLFTGKPKTGNTRKALEKVFPRLRKSGTGGDKSASTSGIKLRKSTSPPMESSNPQTPSRPGQIRRHTESTSWFERRRKRNSSHGTKTSESSGGNSMDQHGLSQSVSAVQTLVATPPSAKPNPQVEIKRSEGGSPRLELKETSPIVWELGSVPWDLEEKSRI